VYYSHIVRDAMKQKYFFLPLLKNLQGPSVWSSFANHEREEAENNILNYYWMNDFRCV